MTVLIQDIFSKFDDVPCFTKHNMAFVYGGLSNSLDQRLWRALKEGRILQLRNGLYMTNLFYFQESDRVKLAEFIASQIRFPSYLSLEYVLQKYHLLENFGSITSISSKTGHLYKNFLGTFEFKNVKSLLYCGFEEVCFHQQKYFVATKAKALFDYLYLCPGFPRTYGGLRHYLFEKLRIQWKYFSREDFEMFDQYVWKSNSAKMMRVWDILNKYFIGKDFEKLTGEILK